MRQQFENACYATPKRFSGIVKWDPWDDRGSLSTSPNEIRFVGRRVDVCVRNVVAVSLVRQQIPLLRYAVVNLTLLAIFAVGRLPIAAVLALLIVVNLVGLSTTVRFKWVKVDYEDEPNSRKSVYFADGSLRARVGGVGRTNDLYRAIQDARRVGEAPAAQ